MIQLRYASNDRDSLSVPEDGVKLMGKESQLDVLAKQKRLYLISTPKDVGNSVDRRCRRDGETVWRGEVSKKLMDKCSYLVAPRVAFSREKL